MVQDATGIKTTYETWPQPGPSAVLVLADGMVIEGHGIGAEGKSVGEVCFNTAMSGYQEILTDPSYAGQIVTFTFPHIGNVGANEEDVETVNMAGSSGVRGCIIKADITSPSNYRAARDLDSWLKARGIIGLAGVDTRSLTALIRSNGMPNAVIVYNREGAFDIAVLTVEAAAWPGLEGMDLAKEVTAGQSYRWDETEWRWGEGYGKLNEPRFHVVAVDFGVKRNILRLHAEASCRVTVLPAAATAEDVLAHDPDGVFLTNGPGDPAATAQYAAPMIREVIAKGVPIFGICLGHQLLALALGASTVKMKQGHHGANHPVKDLITGKIEITSMNHGFAVDGETLPHNVEATHVSLFDGSNCGLRLKDGAAFSVQYHPEASPGPRDSHYLFGRFVEMMEQKQAEPAK